MNKRKCLTIIAAAAMIGAAISRITEKKQSDAVRKKKHVPFGAYEAVLKRPMDIMLSSLALVLLSPIMAVVALLVRFKLGTPVLFEQDRPGMVDPETGEEKIFKLYKFRTMTEEKDENGNLLPDEIRLTSFGNMLRNTSLDELPELINILNGDMSIVGPRPLLVKYLPRYSAEQRRRHEVRPGLTGLAQVKGRNSISWEEKFEWDVKYVDHITLLGDLKIIIDTVGSVIKREGISSGTSVTMETFYGSEKN